MIQLTRRHVLKSGAAAGAVAGATRELTMEELGPEFRLVPQTKQNDCPSARAAPHWLQTTGMWLFSEAVHWRLWPFRPRSTTR